MGVFCDLKYTLFHTWEDVGGASLCAGVPRFKFVFPDMYMLLDSSCVVWGERLGVMLVMLMLV